MRSFVNQFCNLVFSMQGPVIPDTRPEQLRKERAKRRRQRQNREYRGAYCQEVIDILNDPTHNKTTE